MATHPPVGAIMGNTEHHSFNFIPSSVPATRYNVIISSRSAGSSDRAVLSRHWGEMQIDFISAVAFLGPSTCYTQPAISGKRYENQWEMSNRGGTVSNAVCCLPRSLAHRARYFLMPRCRRRLCESSLLCF